MRVYLQAWYKPAESRSEPWQVVQYFGSGGEESGVRKEWWLYSTNTDL